MGGLGDWGTGGWGDYSTIHYPLKPRPDGVFRVGFGGATILTRTWLPTILAG